MPGVNMIRPLKRPLKKGRDCYKTICNNCYNVQVKAARHISALEKGDIQFTILYICQLPLGLNGEQSNKIIVKLHSSQEFCTNKLANTILKVFNLGNENKQVLCAVQFWCHA